jgi:hypothetical protein
MKISEIKKLNLKDGDILFVPESCENLMQLCNNFRKVFPKIRFCIVEMPEKLIAGIKVVSVAEVNKK